MDYDFKIIREIEGDFLYLAEVKKFLTIVSQKGEIEILYIDECYNIPDYKKDFCSDIQGL